MWKWFVTGADPGLQVGEGHIKKLRRAEGSANIFGIFRVKNHDFTEEGLSRLADLLNYFCLYLLYVRMVLMNIK